MALIICIACSKQMSAEAEACPNCGQPNKGKKISCPTCNSNNVSKIGAGSKIVSGTVWGVFALGKITKTWQCKSCNYKW